MVYPEVRPHEPLEVGTGFRRIEERIVRAPLELQGPRVITDLFRMPYYWQAPPEARGRVGGLARLTAWTDVLVLALGPAVDRAPGKRGGQSGK